MINIKTNMSAFIFHCEKKEEDLYITKIVTL